MQAGAPPAGSTAAAPPPGAARRERVEWLRISPFIAMHLGCLGVFFTPWHPAAAVTGLLLYLLRMFAITAFYHRYFSHRSFRTSRALQFVFALIGGMSAQRGALWWAAHHRKHHRRSDTPADVHSPRQHGFLWSHMGWFTSRSNYATDLREVGDLARYPELRFLDRYDVLPPALLGLLLLLLGGWPYLLWGFFVSTVLLFHGTFCINSLAHRLGSQRYATGDDSRNSMLLALITLGEGWHNNHHQHAGLARQGLLWWELDVSWYLLLLLERLGLVRDLRRPRGAS